MLVENVNAAIVSAAAGVLTEFVTGVFFYSDNTAMVNMAEYHDAVVATPKYSVEVKSSRKICLVTDAPKSIGQLRESVGGKSYH